MGFGWLIVGYFMAMLMSINMFGSYFRLLGYCIILLSSLRLRRYNRGFGYMSIASVLMLLVSLMLVSADISLYLYDLMVIDVNVLGDNFKTIVGYVEMGTVFVFNATMLYGIRAIAEETGETKISVSAVRNFVFVCIYYVLNVLSFLPFKAFEDFGKYFSAPALLLYFAWIILNLVLIYSCYARICDENDVDMEIKPSRFAFVNKMRQSAEERRLHIDAEREEYKSMREQRRKK